MNKNKNKRDEASLPKKFKPSIDKNELDTSASKSSEQKQTGDKSGQVVLLGPTSSLSSEEKVFSIDHIVESIFHKLDRQTLVNCRLVSRRWANFASKALQNLVNIDFVLVDDPCPPDPRSFSFKWNGRSINDLVNVMNNSTEFPCNSFSMRDKSVRSFESVISDFEPFFNTHGSHIRKLEFHSYVSTLDELKSIISNQALKLSHLVLRYLRPSSQWQTKRRTHVKGSRQGKASVDKTLTKLNEPVFKNLKVFKCFSCIPDSIIRQIFESAPNLVEVILHHRNLHCLIANSANRLHLVKTLIIDINENNLPSLQNVADNHQNNWAVEELYFEVFPYCMENLGIELVDIMGKILHGVSATCTKLVWGDFIDNFQIPQMPQVKHLSFTYEVNDDTGLPQNNLPAGVSLQDTFPNLNSLKVGRRLENIPIEKIFDCDNPVPLPNVKNVTLTFRSIDENLLQSFRKMFPNATIQEDERSDHIPLVFG